MPRSVRSKAGSADVVLEPHWEPAALTAYLAPAKEQELILQPVLCDLCVSPGMCCRAMNLNETFPREWGEQQVKEHVHQFLDSAGRKYDMLVPIRRTYNTGAEMQWAEVHWLFSCTKLTPEGRCGIYEDRPDMCRDYKPGTDGMCIHFRGKDGRSLVPQRPA